MTTKTVVPANWVLAVNAIRRKAGLEEFPVVEKVTASTNGDGKVSTRIQAVELGVDPKPFTKESAKKIIQAYQKQKIDLGTVGILLGKNTDNKTTLKQWLIRLGEIGEKQGYLTSTDFQAAGVTLGKPGKNRIYNAICCKLMLNGCYVEKQRGQQVEEIENPVDLDDIEL